ncbi:MAG: hypothetical protein ACKO7P_11680 [Bacteroidota bacterium]
MNEVFRTSTQQYEPSSFGGNYLYDQYGKIISFLKYQDDASIGSHLAKPEVKEGVILWYSKFIGPMTLVQDLSEESKERIKQSFYVWRKKIESISDSLKYDRDNQKRQWGEMLALLLEGVDVITNGNEWCVIWGWNFRTGNDQYLLPIINTPLQTEPSADGIEIDLIDRIEPIAITPIDNSSEENVKEIHHHHHYHNNENSGNRIGFFERIKRWLRWFVYRFWALLLLIMIILILLCLCKKCNKCDKCEKTVEYNQKIEQIENDINKRCNTK